MSSVIYKYELPSIINKIVEVIIPCGEKILDYQLQHDEFCIWAVVDTKEEMCDVHKFYITGTGHNLPEFLMSEEWGHVKTIQCGEFVWHIFKETHPKSSVKKYESL